MLLQNEPDNALPSVDEDDYSDYDDESDGDSLDADGGYPAYVYGDDEDYPSYYDAEGSGSGGNAKSVF